jgi:hypothetical protein
MSYTELPENVRVTAAICDADAGSAPSQFVEMRKTARGQMYIFQGKNSADVPFGVIDGDETVYTGDDIKF